MNEWLLNAMGKSVAFECYESVAFEWFENENVRLTSVEVSVLG